jgi:hypothetical protein
MAIWEKGEKGEEMRSGVGCEVSGLTPDTSHLTPVYAKNKTMKQFIIAVIFFCLGITSFAQQYPDPEFSNEVYYLKKDSTLSVVRLEKGSSKMENKAKMGGFGGAESGYSLDGEKSEIRLHTGTHLSFVFSTGASGRPPSSPQADSMMRANGMDPAMMNNMSMGSMMDPAHAVKLYKAESAKGRRKIIMQKMPGAMPFGSKKIKSSDEYTFSIKKIREGYWELVLDKSLPKGEYAFSVMNMGMGSADGSTTLYAFAVE